VRPARSASELDRFAEGYELVSGYRVDRAYLDRAQVLVAVRAGRVVGGFALNVEPPFRTMARLPEAEQRRLAPAFPTDDTVELTCVWLAPEARGHVSSATLWGKLVWHASRRRRTRVVFGTEVDRLRRLYELTGPELLYEGEVRVDGQVASRLGVRDRGGPLARCAAARGVVEVGEVAAAMSDRRTGIARGFRDVDAHCAR
jgi:hypothetical protein